MLTLITGGARSGKSSYAQRLCSEARSVVYVATATRDADEEMIRRIDRHRESRPAWWRTIEEPLNIADAVKQHAHQIDVILLDCLTLWLSNFLCRHRDQNPETLERDAAAELSRLAEMASDSHLIVVTNEVGSGIVPDHPLGRIFRDLQGFANQHLARLADAVYLTVAGIPIQIKPQQSQ